MPKMTQQQKLVAGLVALGHTEITPTKRYRVFAAPIDGYPTRKLYVGKAGALRVSTGGRVSDTFECPAQFRTRVLEAANTGEAK